MEKGMIGKSLMVEYLTELIRKFEEDGRIIIPVDVMLLKNVLALLKEET